MAYQFVSEDPMPAQKPPLQERVQVTEYKTQKIYDSNAHKELILLKKCGKRGTQVLIAVDSRS